MRIARYINYLGLASFLGVLLLMAAVPLHKVLAAEDVTPNATAAEANGTCDTTNAHTAMDDDVDGGGDASECAASVDLSNHDIRLNFATPSGNPSTAANAQTFALLVKRRKATGTGNPTVALDLYCNGALVEAGADQTFTTTYSVITETFTFNSGSCASDGSDVEVLLDCTAADNGGTNNDNSCTYEAVEWRAEITNASPTVALNTPADAGTVNTVTPDLTFTGTDSESNDIRYNVQISDNSNFATELNSSSTLVSDAALEGYYRMSNGALTTDSGPDGRTLTNNNSVTNTASGLFGYGSDTGTSNTNKSLSYTTDTMGITSAGPITMMGWVNLNSSLAAGTVRFMEFDIQTNFVYFGIFYEYNGGSPRILFVRTRYGVGDSNIPVSGTLSTGVWMHLALTYDGTTLRAYVNGVEEGTGVAASGNGSFWGAGGVGLGIGRGIVDNAGFFDWKHDDVAVYSRALNAAEIAHAATPSINKISGTDSLFSGTPDNTDPFASGQAVTYTVQAGDALTNGNTYYWRARGIDPSGSNAYGDWSSTRSFTVSVTAATEPPRIYINGNAIIIGGVRIQ